MTNPDESHDRRARLAQALAHQRERDARQDAPLGPPRLSQAHPVRVVREEPPNRWIVSKFGGTEQARAMRAEQDQVEREIKRKLEELRQAHRRVYVEEARLWGQTKGYEWVEEDEDR